VFGLAIGSALLALAAACSGTPGTQTVPPITVPTAPSLPSAVPDQNLEALFPDDIAGNPLQITSATGEGVLTQFAQDNPDEFRNFVEGLGANMDQVSVAFSFNIWPVPSVESEFTGLTMAAMRIAGLPAATTLPAFVEFVKEDVGEGAEVSQQTVAGKTVTAVVDPEDAENAAFLYPVGDVVFLVGGTPNHVEEAFAKLP
jgi:hypothetical protein